MTDYESLCLKLTALTDGVPHRIANLANASALIYETLEDLNWAGFYLLEGDTLVLGPFQGRPACIEIPLGRGVCGTAAQENKTRLVPDVHLFPGHIACDSASNSEIVVPLRVGGEIVGVLYDKILAQYRNPEDPETQKSLNKLCVRLVFCLYAEDAPVNESVLHEALESSREEYQNDVCSTTLAALSQVDISFLHAMAELGGSCRTRV